MATTPPREELTSIAVATAAVALLLRAGNAGWGLLIFGIGYLALCGIHIVVHRRAGGRSSGWSRPFVTAVAASNVALIGALLLQWDFNDNGDSRVTFDALSRLAKAAGPAAWLDERSNWAILSPIATWPLVLVAAGRGRRAVAAAFASAVVGLAPLAVIAAALVIR